MICSSKTSLEMMLRCLKSVIRGSSTSKLDALFPYPPVLAIGMTSKFVRDEETPDSAEWFLLSASRRASRDALSSKRCLVASTL